MTKTLPSYEEFYNYIREKLINGLISHETVTDIDRYLSTDKAKDEIKYKYKDAKTTFETGETTYEQIFSHYADSAASSLYLMYE